MVLNIKGPPSLFPASFAYGEGFRKDTTVEHRNDGGFGASKISLLHSEVGEAVNTVGKTLDLFQFHTGDIKVDEELWIVIDINDKSTGALGTINIRCEDSVGVSGTGNIISTKGKSEINFYLSQDQSDDGNLLGAGVANSSTLTPTATTFNLTDENIITTNFKFYIFGNVHTGGTLYWKIWIYRRNH